MARIYFEQDKVSRTMTTSASTAINLPRKTLDTLFTTMNSKVPHLFQSQHNVNTNTSELASGLHSNGDCRVLRESFKLHSFYSCSPFTISKTDLTLKRRYKLCTQWKNYSKPMVLGLYTKNMSWSSTIFLFLLCRMRLNIFPTFLVTNSLKTRHAQDKLASLQLSRRRNWVK